MPQKHLIKFAVINFSIDKSGQDAYNGTNKTLK